jgi:hypothetical protein
MRKIEEKNKPGGINKRSSLFNSIIDYHELIELELKNRLCTWSNNRSDPTFEKLDRFLVSPEWDLAYNNVNVRGLNRSFSDHVPLCLSIDSTPSCHREFRYELCWNLIPNFHQKVIANWSLPVNTGHS